MRCNFIPVAMVGVGLALTTAAIPARGQATDSASQQRQPGENPIDRWNRMTPEERERELAKLPPARARWIRQQLRRYNQMQPEEKEQLRARYKTFIQLSPALQQVVRGRLREFRQLAPARQTAVHREVLALREVPEDQRAARMDSEDIRSRFSPEERQIIRDLAEYLDIKP